MKFSIYQAFKEALSEADKGVGFVEPNPPVGCVVLDSRNHFLSKGYHKKYGEVHAEVMALKGASLEQLKGGKIFVTLEPCNSFGKTPPCVDLIKSLPVSEVYYICKDPLAQGSRQTLESFGKKVISLEEVTDVELSWRQKRELQQEALHQLDVFLFQFSNVQRPFLVLKSGCSLDGKIALSSGESQWITSESARQAAHLLRAKHSTIMVGAGTVLKDNPTLNIRRKGFEELNTRVVIFDPKGKVQKLSHLKMFQAKTLKQVILLSPTPLLKNKHMLVTHLPLQEPLSLQILNQIFEKLKQEFQMHSILVEGGSGLQGLLLSLDLMDKLHLFVDHSLLGSGLGWSEGLQIDSLSQRMTLQKPFICSHEDYLEILAFFSLTKV